MPAEWDRLPAFWNEVTERVADPAAGAVVERKAVKIKVPLGLQQNPPVPTENPMTVSKWQLGKKLYFDPILSSDGTVSCARRFLLIVTAAVLLLAISGMAKANDHNGQRIDDRQNDRDRNGFRRFDPRWFEFDRDDMRRFDPRWFEFDRDDIRRFDHHDVVEV